MSQHETSTHSRSAIIADLACIIGEVAVLQERQAAITTANAAIQGRLAKMVRDLSQSTAMTRVLNEADIKRMGELLQRPSSGSPERSTSAAPATQAASPPGASPAGQDEGQPVQVRKASDDRSAGVSGSCTADRQSGESRHVAGAGSASAASADTAPAADVKPKRIFQQPLQKTIIDPEPRKFTAGGGLVQGGPVPKRPYIDGTIINMVISRYHSHTESAPEIDRALDIQPGTSRIVIDEARGRRDERVQEADRARAAKLSRETGPLSPPARPALPAPKPAPAAPATPAATKLAEPGERAPAGETDPVIVIDTKGARIVGPAGEWKRVTPVVCKTLAPLATGNLLGVDRMMQAGGWAKDVQVLRCIPNWSAELAKIGVTLVHTKGIGVKLNRREVAA